MADQPDLPELDIEATNNLAKLNDARFYAHRLAFNAVAFLAKVMDDDEEDTDRRIMAAAELLAFAKVP